MKERPILFNGDMVRAILEGRKTQTRRIVKSQPHDTDLITVGHYHPIVIDRYGDEDAGAEIFGAYSEDGEWGTKFPYGQPGDRLWVRETWMPDPSCDDDAWDDEGLSYYEWNGCGSSISGIPKALCKVENVIHKASWDGQEMVGWKPSIHMPRWASRITLEITGVSVERLNEISEQDAKAEGIDDGGCTNCGEPEKSHPVMKSGQPWYPCEVAQPDYRDSFVRLWESINGPGSWEANPWVWVVEFKRITP